MDAISVEIAASEVADGQRRIEGGAPIQDPLIVEDQHLAGLQLVLELVRRIADQPRQFGERLDQAVDLLDRTGLWRQAAVVVAHPGDGAARVKADDMRLGAEEHFARVFTMECHAVPREQVEQMRRVATHQLGDLKAIDHQRRAAAAAVADGPQLTRS